MAANQLNMLRSSSGAVHASTVSVGQRETVDVECNQLTEHVRVVVQVPRVTQHRSLRQEAVEQRPLVLVEPDQVLDAVARFKVESVELETDEAEDVAVRQDALCRDRLRQNFRLPLQMSSQHISSLYEQHSSQYHFSMVPTHLQEQNSPKILPDAIVGSIITMTFTWICKNFQLKNNKINNKSPIQIIQNNSLCVWPEAILQQQLLKKKGQRSRRLQCS